MMSPDEYNARADTLVVWADASVSELMILEMEATAVQWRQMAGLAHLQDVFQAALTAQAAELK